MRYAARIEYQGTYFHGWQRQANAVSVQQTLEQALSKVADQEIGVVCAGRTDTGVHGIGQIVHFDSKIERGIKAWVMGSNTWLPKSVAVKMVKPVDATFHARFSAERRTYRYVIDNQPVRSPVLDRRVLWVLQSLDIDSMRKAAQYLLGKHDFTAFRSAGCQANNPIRIVEDLAIIPRGQRLYIDITANAFLQNMVRIIVGTLLKVGKGEKKPQWIKQLIDGKDRAASGMTAPAHGLYFIGPSYPVHFDIHLPKNWPMF